LFTFFADSLNLLIPVSKGVLPPIAASEGVRDTWGDDEGDSLGVVGGVSEDEDVGVAAI
jgi:hypothetical protein